MITDDCRSLPDNRFYVGLLLVHCLRRLPNSKPTLGQRLLFAGFCVYEQYSIIIIESGRSLFPPLEPYYKQQQTCLGSTSRTGLSNKNIDELM